VARSADPAGAILIADGDARMRDELAALFERVGFRTTRASNGYQALELIGAGQPAAAILEPALSGVTGYEICRALRDRYGDAIPIVFVSANRTESFDRIGGLLLGADDYVPKPFAADELIARVRRLLHRADTPVSPAISSKLTKRELEVLGLLAEGLTQTEIASKLVISQKTVGSHIERILSKLGVRSRAQAVALAYRQDLVPV
jgi:DNA-binding NarL/FixJ family response regulator